MTAKQSGAESDPADNKKEGESFALFFDQLFVFFFILFKAFSEYLAGFCYHHEGAVVNLVGKACNSICLRFGAGTEDNILVLSGIAPDSLYDCGATVGHIADPLDKFVCFGGDDEHHFTGTDTVQNAIDNNGRGKRVDYSVENGIHIFKYGPAEHDDQEIGCSCNYSQGNKGMTDLYDH